MKIFTALKTAASRLLKSWKGGLIVWFSLLIMISMMTVPLRGALNSVIGNSMITERLIEGINVEVIADMGAALKTLMSYFSSGLIVTILAAFLLNVFLAGGLFNSLRGASGKFSGGEFFSASARNFWSYLIISLVISVIVVLLLVLIVIVPAVLVSMAKQPVEGAVLKTLFIVVPVFFILLTLLLLIADYARSWQVSKEKKAAFKAIGFGFSMTFRTFFSSFPLMIIVLVVQLLYIWFIFAILSGITPVTGGGVILLFLLSQILFFIKILLKVWRYGSVTTLMEMNRSVEADPGDLVNAEVDK